MRFTSDLFNNIGRMCSVNGDESGRVWRVRTAMRDKEGGRFYLCRNTTTGAFRAVSSNHMYSLY